MPERPSRNQTVQDLEALAGLLTVSREFDLVNRDRHWRYYQKITSWLKKE
jgi:hypothetical protein